MEKRLNGSKSNICSPQGDEHTISLPEFLQRFGADNSGLSGLSEQEAARRLHECGPNVLEETGKESLLIAYLKQFWNFFSVLLIIGALLSFLAEYLDPGKGNLYIGIATELIILALIIWNPFANLIFNTSPLDLKYILLSIPFAIFLLGIDELRKYLLRRNVNWAVKFLKW
jgi:magnesium-transporting ATPase (P-type)